MSRERQRKQQVLQRVDRFAALMDTQFTVPFTRFQLGIEPIIGLLPGVGDAAGLILSSYLLVEAQRAGAPLPLKGRMLANMGIDAVGGLLPVVGDLFDVWFKANTRNARLLRCWLDSELLEDQPPASSWPLMALLAVVTVAVGALLWHFGAAQVPTVALP